MESYKVVFKGNHIGTLTVSEGRHSYVANADVIAEVSKNFPIFDILKKDITAESIPFFKVRLEKNCEAFETDDYELIKL